MVVWSTCPGLALALAQAAAGLCSVALAGEYAYQRAGTAVLPFSEPLGLEINRVTKGGGAIAEFGG